MTWNCRMSFHKSFRVFQLSVNCINYSGKRWYSLSTLKKIRGIFSSSKLKNYRSIPNEIPCPSYVNGGKIVSSSMSEIKTEDQINQMRPACKLAASILTYVENNIEVGMTTDAIDAIVHRKCIEAGAYPSPLDYKGFPKSVCTSVNEVACHGIPNTRILHGGDIINVDITVFFQGYHGDVSKTFLIGNVDERKQLLVKVAEKCRDVGIDVCRHGAPFSDIGESIYTTAIEAGFQVIPHFCGHGIGEYFHGPPDIIHVPSDSVGDARMVAGMTFTVEPIICDGLPEIEILNDGWTVVTRDRSASAQFEHTILITKDGYEILTVT